MRRIDLPYRTAYNDMLCCHPDIASECEWRYAGAIIINDGETPDWCPEYGAVTMDKCKYCGERSPNIVNDACVGCLADRCGDIVEMTPEALKRALRSDIKFVELQDQGVGYAFALFNMDTEKFVIINDKSVWNCFLTLALDIRYELDGSGQNPGETIEFYVKLCPDWVLL